MISQSILDEINIFLSIYIGNQKWASEASEAFGNGLERGGQSCALEFMISNMAEPNWVKLSGII